MLLGKANLLHHDLYELPPPSAYNEGRVALVVDAAHAMTPNLGQGACQHESRNGGCRRFASTRTGFFRSGMPQARVAALDVWITVEQGPTWADS